MNVIDVINIENMKPCPYDIQEVINKNFMDLLDTSKHGVKTDPYMNFHNVVQRLKDEYEKHNNLVIAFDFDNTIYDFHNKGYEFPEVIDLLYRASMLNLTLVCYTGNEDTEFVMNYCMKNKIRVDYMNESPIKSVSRPHKPYFSILLDDRAGLASAVEALHYVIYEIEKLKELQND